MRVGIPSRAGITPVAVTWPPGKTDPISKSAVECFEDTCELQQAGVARNVISRPVEPRAIVRANEHKLGLAALQLGSWQADLAPALESIRGERRPDGAVLQCRNNSLAVGPRNGTHGHPGDVVDLLEFRRAPDRRNDHLVPLPARRHADHSARTGLGGR